MNFDDSFPKRVAIARNALGFTQAELARRVGIVSRQIAAYEGGEAKPRDKVLSTLAAALGTSPEWLANGAGNGPDVKNVKRTVTLIEIPVYTHISAGSMSLEDALGSSSVVDFIPIPNGAGENSFALVIQGDSMSSSEGVSFPGGSIVTFDPDLEPRNGDYVLCSINEFDTTFKKLVYEEGRATLHPLNKMLYPITFTILKVLGVAVHSQLTNIHNPKSASLDGWNPVAPWWTNRRDEVIYDFESSIEEKVSNLEKKIDLIIESLSIKKNE